MLDFSNRTRIFKVSFHLTTQLLMAEPIDVELNNGCANTLTQVPSCFFAGSRLGLPVHHADRTDHLCGQRAGLAGVGQRPDRHGLLRGLLGPPAGHHGRRHLHRGRQPSLLHDRAKRGTAHVKTAQQNIRTRPNV